MADAGDGAKRRRALTGLFGGLRALLRDRRGTAAVEFALMAPLLVGTYMMSMEASQAITTSRKLSRASSMIGNIAAQQDTVTLTDIDGIMKVGGALLQPYNRSKPTITLTGIAMSEETKPKATVAWSRRLTNDAGGPGLTKGDPIAVPEKLLLPGKFLVLAEIRLAYKPIVAWSASDGESMGVSDAFTNITMGDSHYETPRYVTAITCSNC